MLRELCGNWEGTPKTPLELKIFHSQSFIFQCNQNSQLSDGHYCIIATFISGYQSILHSLLKNKAPIIFIHSLALRCNFAWKSAFYNKEQQLKTIYCFFLQLLHWKYFRYFFSAVLRDKTESGWMRISAEKFVFYWMGKNQFPHPRFPYWCAASFFTALRAFDSRCRFKSLEKSPRKSLFGGRVIFHRRKCFIRPPKMNIWQIETGFSDN